MLRAPRLLDVKTGNTLLDQVIVIECNKIASVDSTKSLRAIAQAEQIGLPNSTALPGLIGCHTHLTIDPNLLGPARLHLFNPRFALIGARNARVTLEAGFTTVRNLAAQGYTDIGLRDAINAGDVPGPHMLASGPALSITGGLGRKLPRAGVCVFAAGPTWNEKARWIGLLIPNIRAIWGVLA